MAGGTSVNSPQTRVVQLTKIFSFHQNWTVSVMSLPEPVEAVCLPPVRDLPGWGKPGLREMQVLSLNDAGAVLKQAVDQKETFAVRTVKGRFAVMMATLYKSPSCHASLF